MNLNTDLLAICVCCFTPVELGTSNTFEGAFLAVW